MQNHIDFSFGFGGQQSAHTAKRREAQALHILVISNLSGHSPQTPISEKRPLSIDIDNFDEVMRRLSPRVQVPISGPASTVVDIEFCDLDDFHPDALFDRLPCFSELRSTKQALANPASFHEAVARLEHVTQPQPSDEPSTQASPQDQEADDLLTRLLGKPATQEPPPAPSPQHDSLNRYIQQLVAPDIRNDIHWEQAMYMAALDSLIAERMRDILHHPDFQALEASWRSLDELLKNIEMDETTTVHVLDRDKGEIRADLESANGDLAQTALHQTLIEGSLRLPDEEPWALLVDNMSFGQGADDMKILEALGRICAELGTPFVAGAQPSLLGCAAPQQLARPETWSLNPDESAAWMKLKQNSETAPWINLMLPRILMRLPYGKDTDPIERFQFEELIDAEAHEQLLWGNPAYLCARRMAEIFSETGTVAMPDAPWEVGDLPAFNFTVDDETRLLPCAEVLLSEHAVAKISQEGLVVVDSNANSNRVRVMGMNGD